MRKLLFAVLAFFAVNAGAAIVGPIPNNLTNGTTIDAVPVMANYNWIMNQVNANGAPLASPTFTGTVTGGAGGFVGALTGNVAGNASTATTAGTVTTAAQPSITSVGTLTGLTMGGNVGLGANHLSYGGTAAGLSFDSSNNATLSGTLGVNTSVGGTGLTITSTAPSTATYLSLKTLTNPVGAGSYLIRAQQSDNSDLFYVKGDGSLTASAISGTTGSFSTGLAVTGTTSSTSFADSGGHLIISSTAPAIASGFGTSPSCTVCNNTAAFRITIGSGGTASYGAITMPTAPHGWSCGAVDISNYQSMDTIAVGNSTTNVLLANYQRSSTTGAVPWNAGDLISVHCTAY